MRVTVSQVIPQSAATLWARLRLFARNWHPMVAEMWAEPGGVRAFRMTGEPGLYRERLTWLSDSDCTLSYTHLEGIDGVTAYDGQLTAKPHPQGATLVMTADIAAPDPARLLAIADRKSVV